MVLAESKRRAKLILQITAMILALLLLASCAGRMPAGRDKRDDEARSEDALQPEEPTEEPDSQPGTSGSGESVADSFSAYTEAKGELVTRLSNALANNPGTEFDSMSLLNLVMVDMLLPASVFGAGEEAASFTLGILGAQNIVYTEDGNRYSVKYDNEEGHYEVQGFYNEAADALKCAVLADGKEILSSEYYKTSYGYAGQIFAAGDEGSSMVYQLTISGQDGVVGISEAAAAPSELTGGETPDFPKSNKEWYAIEGTQVTGVTADGREISFEYTPPDDNN